MENQAEVDEITSSTQNFNYVPSSIISDYFYNEKYLIILKSLESGYQTIEELYKHYLEYYNQDRPLVKNAQDTGRFILWDKKFKKKSKSTFYRWINDLISVDLVSNAGLRINLANNSLQKLYGLRAQINIPSLMGTGVQTESKQKIMKLIARLMNTTSDHSKLTMQLITFSLLFENQSKEILENNVNFMVNSINSNRNVQEILERIKDLDHFGYISIFFYFNLLGFLYFDQKWIKILTEIKKNHTLQDLIAKKSNTYSFFQNTMKINEQENKILDRITVEPEKMMLISGTTWRTAFSNPKYRVLFNILKSYPMTLKQIHFKYIQSLEKINHARSEKKLAPLPKIQENTMYKYLVELRKQGLVIEAGRRIITGKNFMEILYSRSAIFYNFDMKMSEESWRHFTGILACIFEIIIGKPVIHDKFHVLMFQLIQDFNDFTVKALIQCNDEELIRKIIALDENEYLFLNRNLGLIYTLSSVIDLEEFKKNILLCFRD